MYLGSVWVEERKSGKIENILVFSYDVWFGVKKWRDRKLFL